MAHGFQEKALKTLYTHSFNFLFTTPLVLFGARFSLGFAEFFWDREVKPSFFLEQDWVTGGAGDLSTFASQIEKYVQAHRSRKYPYPLLTPALEESAWLAAYSPRHKRRLYKSVYGLSRKELLNIHKVHVFLEQECSFDEQSPRIIEHITPDVFYDQPHLNHAFKKTTGLAPVEYFATTSILQDNLMADSYNAISQGSDII